MVYFICYIGSKQLDEPENNLEHRHENQPEHRQENLTEQQRSSGFNFTNILQAAFCTKMFWAAIHYSICFGIFLAEEYCQKYLSIVLVSISSTFYERFLHQSLS